jgi:hypothetical protein
MAVAAVGAVLVGFEFKAPPPPPPPPPPKPTLAVPDAEAGRNEWEEGRQPPRLGGRVTTPRQRVAAAATATSAASLLTPPPCVSGHL